MVPESVKALSQTRRGRTQVVEEQDQREARVGGVLKRVRRVCNACLEGSKRAMRVTKQRLDGVFDLVTGRERKTSDRGNHLLGLPLNRKEEEEAQWRQRLKETLSEVDHHLANKKISSAFLVIMTRLFALFEDVHLGRLDQHARVQKELEGILNLKNQVESKFVLFRLEQNVSEAGEVCDLYFGRWGNEEEGWIPGIRDRLDQGKEMGLLDPKLVERSKDLFEKEILLGLESEDCAKLSEGPGLADPEREEARDRVANTLAERWHKQWSGEPAALEEKKKEGDSATQEGGGTSPAQDIASSSNQSVVSAFNQFTSSLSNHSSVVQSLIKRIIAEEEQLLAAAKDIMSNWKQQSRNVVSQTGK